MLYKRARGDEPPLQLQGFSLNTESCQTQVDAGPGVLVEPSEGTECPVDLGRPGSVYQ